MAVATVRNVRLEHLPPASATDSLADRAQPYDALEERRIRDFFERNGLRRQMRAACHAFARAHFPHVDIAPVKAQGYCSYTLAVSSSHLLQFRPEAHQLDVAICAQAKTVFGSLVPKVDHLGGLSQGDQRLEVYLQEKIPGVTLQDFRSARRRTGTELEACNRRLVEDLACVFALSFRHRHATEAGAGSDALRKGKVGSSLRWRLNLLQGLHTRFLRDVAAQTLSAMDEIEASPWCLTHGDLIPANIMVDPVSGRLTGLIDWAEGEWLPFGVGLYGLEEVLGYDDSLAGFQYYENHQGLRNLFFDKLRHLTAWETSGTLVCPHKLNPCRSLGILLWRGIAFEDGRLDRVVEAGRDDPELRKLNLFLQAPMPHAPGTSSDFT